MAVGAAKPINPMLVVAICFSIAEYLTFNVNRSQATVRRLWTAYPFRD